MRHDAIFAQSCGSARDEPLSGKLTNLVSESHRDREVSIRETTDSTCCGPLAELVADRKTPVRRLLHAVQRKSAGLEGHEKWGAARALAAAPRLAQASDASLEISLTA